MRAKHAIGALAILFGIAACGGGGNEAADQGATTAGKTAGETATTGGETAGATTTVTAPASTGAALQAQEVNGAAGMVAELTEATREDGVLTIKVRLRNTGTEERYKSFETNHGAYTLFYVTAENQKYFILKDSEGEPLAPVYLTVTLGPGETSTWWGKYPAPPSSVTEFDFIMHEVPPFENIPITDR